MDQAILTRRGTVFTLQTLCKIQKSDLFCEYEKMKRSLFDDFIQKKLGSSMSYTEKHTPENYISYEENYK